MILAVAKLSGGIKQHVLNVQKHSCHRFTNLTYSDVPVVPIPVLRALSFTFFGFFYGLNRIRKHKIEAIHAHYLVPAGLLGLLLSKATGKPLLVTIHGSDAYGLSGLTWLKRLIARNATVVCVSKALTDLFPGEIVPNGIDPDEIASAREVRLKRPAILFVGSLLPSKVGFLPEIIPRLPEANFYVIGDGALKGRTGGIELHDVSRKRLFDYYRSADCFISTSEWEGFGLSVLEAMASGCPVVVRPVGALKALVEGHGTFASTPDEFVKAIREIIKTRPDTKAASGYAKKFTWEASAKKMDSIYDDVGKV